MLYFSSETKIYQPPQVAGISLFLMILIPLLEELTKVLFRVGV